MRFTGGLPETICGAGSTLATTENLRAKLPGMLRDLLIWSLIDAPCGDFNWMSQTDLSDIDYVGYDVDRAALQTAEQKTSRPGYEPSVRRFSVFDIVSTKVPVADAVLCRDFLQHLPTSLVWKALDNIQTCCWILATSHQNKINEDIERVGDFRPLNLTVAPFNFPAPRYSIDDPPGSGRIIGAWLSSDIKCCM